MRYRGNILTWSNKQNNKISSKLVWVLINVEWIGEYPEYETKFLNPGVVSNHSSMVVYLMNKKVTQKKSLGFCNFWTQEEDFISIVHMAWQYKVKGNPMCICVNAKVENIEESIDSVEQS